MKLFSISTAVMGAVVALALSSGIQNALAQDTGTKSFTVVAEKIGTTKFWLPSILVVNQGDKVKLKLVNDIEGEPNQHGFSIPAYNVTELVTRGTPVTVDFTADKPGVFPFICQVHPAHIGGQLVVHKAN
jgi:plastocyanin